MEPNKDYKDFYPLTNDPFNPTPNYLVIAHFDGGEPAYIYRQADTIDEAKEHVLSELTKAESADDMNRDLHFDYAVRVTDSPEFEEG